MTVAWALDAHDLSPRLEEVVDVAVIWAQRGLSLANSVLRLDECAPLYCVPETLPIGAQTILPMLAERQESEPAFGELPL